MEWKVADGGNGHFYEVILLPGAVTWQTARNDALAKGGDLASIASAEENDFVFGLVDFPEYWTLFSPFNYGPWIGGYQLNSDFEPAGNWTWSDGTSWGFTSWASGQPDNAGAVENRAHYFVPSNSRNDTWNDWTSAGALKAYVFETLSPGTGGDFDGNGIADAFDFLSWQRDPNLGSLSDWESNYGRPIASASTAVPEPSGILLVSLATLIVLNHKTCGSRRWH